MIGRPKASGRVTMAVLLLAVSPYTLLQSMTVPALPRIQTELDTDQVTVAWVLTAFLISASVATPIAGRLGDAYGRKRALVTSLVLLAVGGLAASLATNIWLLVAARVVQGLAGGVLPLSFAIVRDELSVEGVASAIGSLSSLMSAGFAAGIVVTGPILEHFGYDALFVLPTLMAAVAAVGTALYVPESVRLAAYPVRIAPAVALSAWLVLLLLSVTRAPSWGWSSPQTLLGLGAALTVAALWVRIESVVDAPLIDLRMAASRGIAAPNLVAFLIGVAMFGSFAFLPQLIQTPPGAGYGFGASVGEAGHLMLPMSVCSFLSAMTSTRLRTRLGARALIVGGCMLTACGLLAAAFAHQFEWQIALSGALSGVGTGFVFAALANVVVEAAPRERTGVATGINANLRTIGGAIGTAVLATIVTSHLHPSGLPAEHGYTVGFAGLAVTAVLAGLAGLAIPARAAHQGSGGRVGRSTTERVPAAG